LRLFGTEASPQCPLFHRRSRVVNPADSFVVSGGFQAIAGFVVDRYGAGASLFLAIVTAWRSGGAGHRNGRGQGG
jgi:hypothetical protein